MGEMTLEQQRAIALARARRRRQESSTAAPEESLGAKVAGGAVEPLMTLASGTIAAPVAGLAGLFTQVGQGVGLDKVPLLGALVPKENPADVVQGVQSRFTYEPQTQGGKDALSVIGAPFEALDSAATEAGGIVSDLTKSPSAGATTKAGLSLIPALLGARFAKTNVMPTPLKAMRGGSEALMRSSLKPSAKEVRLGNADKAVATMLDEGVSVSEGGINKLATKIDSINDSIRNSIAGSKATVRKSDIAEPLMEVEGRFAKQATPQADLKAIGQVFDDFAAHPLAPGETLPVQLAQEIKQGTYRALKDKYGEVGSAATEAQKALARGAKEQVAAAVPEVAPLNAKESALLNAKNILEHRLAVEGNKNPMGLGPLAASGARTAAFMADRSALLKSLLARAMNPGKGMGISDEMVLAATAPSTFSETDRKRRAVIEALLGRM